MAQIRTESPGRIIGGGCFPSLPSLKIHFPMKVRICRKNESSQRLILEFPPLIKTIPSLMKSWHLRHALYAGEILEKRITSEKLLGIFPGGSDEDLVVFLHLR
ncbi:MAG: hypothetical protein WCP55_22125 [Lentisphaerota bacterium]